MRPARHTQRYPTKLQAATANRWREKLAAITSTVISATTAWKPTTRAYAASTTESNCPFSLSTRPVHNTVSSHGHSLISERQFSGDDTSIAFVNYAACHLSVHHTLTNLGADTPAYTRNISSSRCRCSCYLLLSRTFSIAKQDGYRFRQRPVRALRRKGNSSRRNVTVEEPAEAVVIPSRNPTVTLYKRVWMGAAISLVLHISCEKKNWHTGVVQPGLL